MWKKGPPYFLEGFDPSVSSDRLKIPDKFLRNMEGRTSGMVLLVGPSGQIWPVDLVQECDGLYFHGGWAAFARDHLLEHGDSLVFRYDGDLQFGVQVFDRSSCEKETAFTVKSSQDQSNNGHIAKKRDRTLLGSIIEGVPKRTRSSQVPSEYMSKNQTTDADPADHGSPHSLSFSNEMENDALKNSVTIAIPSDVMALGENSEAAPLHTTSMEDIFLSAEEAEKAAKSFTSCFPNFTKVMKRFNISGSYTLNIPYQFAMEHLPKCKVKIVLRNLKGQSWTVNSIPTTRVQTSHTFCGGWLGFVRDNYIDIGDICIFELVSKCELRVRILRVGKEGMDEHRSKSFRKALVNGLADTSYESSEHKSTLKGNSNNASLQRISKVHISDEKGSNCSKTKRSRKLNSSAIRSRSMTCNGELAIWDKTSPLDKQASHTRGYTSLKSAPEEKIAAQTFVSNFPHFVRIMKKFNVSGSYTLKIPYQFSMEHLPNCRTEILLRNSKGDCWTVNSIPSTKVQTLHTFCGGWMAFVRDNDVKMGDICIFELVGKCEMRVHISGIGKKALDYRNGKNTSEEFPVKLLMNCLLGS